MRVDWCVSSWFRIKNTHSLTRCCMSRGEIRCRPFFDRRNSNGARLPASLICCVSVEVMRARVRAARVRFWFSFIPVMKCKPTLPRARTRTPRSSTLSHPPRATPLTR